MAYVALSRARNLEGLQIDTFDATKIYANDRVKAFYQGLSSTVDELVRSGDIAQSNNTQARSKFKMEPSSGIIFSKSFMIALCGALLSWGSLSKLAKHRYCFFVSFTALDCPRPKSTDIIFKSSRAVHEAVNSKRRMEDRIAEGGCNSSERKSWPLHIKHFLYSILSLNCFRVEENPLSFIS